MVFVDHRFPAEYADLVEGRADLVGLGGDDGLARADGLLVGAARRWDGPALDAAARARVVSRIGVGYDNVDVGAANARRITVCTTPWAPAVSTAEHALALILAVTKRLPAQIERARRAERAEPVGRALELDGRTLGLVGLGRIASRVAVAAQALGMRVIAHDPLLDASAVPGVELVDLAALLAGADVVSLHAPALPETHHLIGAPALAAMRTGSYLVNCARGSLVDTDALLAALQSGHLAGAGLDVTEPEPLPADHPLLARADVVVTPHVASSTVAGRRRLYQHSIDNLLAVLAGGPADVVGERFPAPIDEIPDERSMP